MRFLRFFLLSLALVLGLAALLTGVAFIPAVQTSIAQRVFDRHPELRATLGSLAAGRGQLAVRDLNLVVGGAILALPSAEAQLPVTAALWHRTVHLRRLTAKGWVLDLSSIPAPGAPASPAPAPTPAIRPPAPTLSPPPTLDPGRAALLIAHHFLATTRLPSDFAIDEVDLEGEVLVPLERGRPPVSVHTIVRGGGLGAGRESSFTIEFNVPSTASTYTVAPLRAACRLTIALAPAGSPQRVALDAEIAAKPHTWPDGLHLITDWSAGAAASDELSHLELRRGNRRLARTTVHRSSANRDLAGTWELAVTETDLAPVIAPRVLPGVAFSGHGDFASDALFTQARVTGQLSATIGQPGVLAPALASVGAVKLSADFGAAHNGTTLQFDRLEVALDADRSVAAARAEQAFAIDETTGDLRVTDPRADWLTIALRGVPLTWFTGQNSGLVLTGPGITGELGVRAGADGFAVQSRAPLRATDVAVQSDSAALATGLDATTPLTAHFAATGWTTRFSPLSISHAGRQLALLALTASQAAGAKAIKLDAAWSADLAALRTETPLGARGFFSGRTAEGTCAVLAGAATNVESKFVLTGADASRTLTASVHVNLDATGRFTFFAPLKLTLGRETSEFTAEGNGVRGRSDQRTTINLTGNRLVLDHLPRFTAPLTAAGVAALPARGFAALSAPSVITGARDTTPFWGSGSQRVGFDFAHVTASGDEYGEIGGTLFLDPDKITLDGGRGVFHEDRRVRGLATLTFDPKAESPYRLRGTAAVDEIDASLLVGAKPADVEPLLRGRFAVAASLTGEGLNLNHLAWNTEEEFRLTSLKGGSTTLLQTKVANAFTEAPTPGSDALGTVGSIFGKLLGTKANILQAERNPVSANTDAVLNFTYATQEFRFDQLAITAVRSSAGTIRLTQVELTALNEHFTGTGQFDAVKGQPLARRPLSLDLRAGFRGGPAGFLKEAGLLSDQKDAQGYSLFRQPMHFGGTLEAIDRSAWREILVTAAAPPAPKKPASK